MAENNQWFKKTVFNNGKAPAINDDFLNNFQEVLNQAFNEVYKLSNIPIGGVLEYYGEEEPENFKFINGQALSKTDYSEVYKEIGDRFRKSDNTDETTFNLPDKRECTGVMYSKDSNIFNEFGKKVGENKHKLALSELPKVSGSFKIGDYVATRSGSSVISEVSGVFKRSNKAGTFDSASNISTSTSRNNNFVTIEFGEDEEFDIVQSSITCNYIMRVK